MLYKLRKNAIEPLSNHQLGALDAHTASVNLQMATSHKFAVITGQEGHHVRNIIGMSESSQRRLILQLLQTLLTPSLLEARARVNDGSVDCVDANIELAELLSGS
jgi:hypothetical protein